MIKTDSLWNGASIMAVMIAGCLLMTGEAVAQPAASAPTTVQPAHARQAVARDHAWQYFKVYKEECGSCHMAYPPFLLPASGWQAILDHLDQHFDDNAELDEDSRNTISKYLAFNAAKVKGTYMPNVTKADALPRITALPRFRQIHREIPVRLVRGNPAIKTISHCDACHLRAESGSFNEHEIYMPGVGRWDDD